MLFRELGLSDGLLKSLEAAGYTEATPIQVKAIPPILEGRDVLGSAQTGTGKTAAFALPVLDRIGAMKAADGGITAIRCLVLVPTRELALQVSTSFNKYGRGMGLRFAVAFGGVSQHTQVQAIRSGVDVLVATPGRMEDLYQQRLLDFSKVGIFILDEGDQMLDMGFIIPIRRVAKTLPANRQTLMFSATMAREIKVLASEMMKNYAEASVAPSGTATELVDQKAFLVDQRTKGFLLRHYIKEAAAFKSLVFTRTKHGADRVARGLVKSGISAAAIHGNRSQSQRTRALEDFKKGKVAVLVATDVASRGLHISDVSHVINFDLPEVAETYVHRIGRTGRAGASGIAVSFVDHEDRYHLRSIEKLLRKQIEILPTPEVDMTETADSREESARFRPTFNDRRDGPQDGRRGGYRGGDNRGDGRSDNRGDYRGDQGGDRRPAPQRSVEHRPARPAAAQTSADYVPAAPAVRREERAAPAAAFKREDVSPAIHRAPLGAPRAHAAARPVAAAGRPHVAGRGGHSARPAHAGHGTGHSHGPARASAGGGKKPSTHFGKSGQRKAWHRDGAAK